METLHLWVSYRLPVSIRVDETMLGTNFPIKVNDLQGCMHTPMIIWTDDGRPLVAPPQVSLEEDRLSKQSGIDQWGWGSVGSWSPQLRTVRFASINSVLFNFSNLPVASISHSEYLYGTGHPAGDTVDKLHHELEDRMLLLLSWLDAVTHQDLNPDDPLMDVRTPSKGMSAWTENDSEVSLPVGPTQHEVHIRELTLVSEEIFTWALDKAGNELSPPIEHLLLVGARRAANRRQTRRAVIDAASASELALTQLLASLLSALPEETHLAMLRERRTLGPLVKLVQNSGITLPPNTMRRLIEPRNRAMHQAEELSLSIANDAIEVASDIVQLVEWLPINGVRTHRSTNTSA